MKSFKKILLGLMLLLGIQSCYYDVEEQLYPSTGCNLSGVTLSGKVKPIIQSRCYSCHSQQNSGAYGGNINVETYANLKAEVDNGKFLKSIKHESGVSPMPKGNTALIDACEIKIIEEWINLGAPND